jgi:Domain of unknown function (DUF1963)
LFFWDNVVGDCFGGPAACRVIWDKSSAANLQRVTAPDVFSEFERMHAENERARMLDMAEIMASDGGTDDAIAIFKAQLEIPIEQWARRPFVYPEQGVHLIVGLQLPGLDTIEALLDKELAAIVEQVGGAFCYDQLSACHDGFPELDYPDSYGHRFLGVPEPEQDDPRLQPFDMPDDGWTEEQLLEVAKQARHWRFLMQIDLHALTRGGLGGGSLYFLIHEADLIQHDFTKVQAWFQTT